jgi:ABC-type oligopeptide transport system ATPase subunit
MIQLDPEQIRIMDWRLAAKDIAAVIGPPGCGKTTVGSALARNMIVDGLAGKVLLTAYTNSATDEFGRELCYLLGISAARQLCLRTGNANAADQSIPIKFSNDAEEINSKRIILCTILSLRKLPRSIKFDRIIIDEASINKIDQLLIPLHMGFNSSNIRSSFYKSNFTKDDYKLPNLQQQLKELMNLIHHCGIAATVVGDPKQSQPISINTGSNDNSSGGSDSYYNSYSAIDWIINSAHHDTLHITHRLPEPLASLVNDFAQYGGLASAPEIATRRLRLANMDSLDHEYKQIIEPDEVITWVDIPNSEETPYRESSWINQAEARACTKICEKLVKLMLRPSSYLAQTSELKKQEGEERDDKQIVIITRFTGQVIAIRNLLAQEGLLDFHNIRVTTTTTALGTQGDIVLFSLVRNNDEKNLGAAGALQDLNVSISRAKEKLIILGSFDMMTEGYCGGYTKVNHARNLAKLIESKYGKVIEAPQILIH